ncbi:DNA replication/repair protein RecF [Methylocystis sp. MJC1]|jgi:DNA replication and repair protein RecF|uniref:DNA replication/repair protein RecF n=1 Tax=Methylocystis sp. MJC1 TaxID=2654282 RepID=UPI0013EBA543|nr:DNA replication/repair protein RecF [Methylocystis sp. MJC1]KAF2989504.1 DNA replication and repair protein RecF [Methylocystis sp. MJC1]MBU6527906.1 DNA replication/repair protein RecF [Methylocystis sp. MJC1]UZX10828.1 DNA replication/repair protein RecF [Methylocystis sp. MJC1]
MTRADSLPAPRVRRLTLADYRSYAQARCEIDARLVALVGENGAGKTNVLEALSLFSPGRGLRRAELSECARRDGSGGFAVSIEIEADEMTAQLGHGLSAEGERQFRIDRTPVSSARAFADHLRVLWLTPAMDGLFNGPAGERRRFLDRLALGVDADHGARVNKLERALRNRNRLLEEGISNKRWLDAAEQEIAALGVAVAAARRETVSRLASLIVASESVFPWAEITIDGEIENILAEAPALAVEERFRETLRDTRRRDAAAGRTLTGPQTSDLAVRHGPKNEAARDCSTGEQKALLMGLTLAHVRLVGEMTGKAPLLLLDEVAAHFDPKRREALFSELEALGGQIWMTGADPLLFASLDGRAEMLLVTPGRIEKAL